MKNTLLTLAVAIGLLSQPAFADSQPLDLGPGESLAQLLQISNDKGFPVSSVEMTYVRGCNQKFSRVALEHKIENGVHQVQVGVILVKIRDFCYHSDPVSTVESVATEVFAMEPIEVVPLSSDTLLDMGGVSVDNFN